MQNNSQNFKDFPNQSHIELKFTSRDQHSLEREEALQKYRKNINILTKLFAYEVDKQPQQQQQSQSQQSSQAAQNENGSGNLTLDSNLLQQLNESLIKLKERHGESLEEFKKKNELFQLRMKEDVKINSQEEFSDFLHQLQSEDLLTDLHPYLDPRSNFYLKPNLQQPMQISYEQCQELKFQMKDEQSILLS